MCFLVPHQNGTRQWDLDLFTTSYLTDIMLLRTLCSQKTLASIFGGIRQSALSIDSDVTCTHDLYSFNQHRDIYSLKLSLSLSFWPIKCWQRHAFNVYRRSKTGTQYNALHTLIKLLFFPATRLKCSALTVFSLLSGGSGQLFHNFVGALISFAPSTSKDKHTWNTPNSTELWSLVLLPSTTPPLAHYGTLQQTAACSSILQHTRTLCTPLSPSSSNPPLWAYLFTPSSHATLWWKHLRV